MRILHVIHSVDPRSGGPSNALRGMVRAQAERGDSVAVVATSIQSAEPWDPETTYRKRMQLDEHFQAVDLRILPAWGRKRPWSRWGYSPASVRELKARLAARTKRPDIVHVHGIFSHLTSTAARLAARAGVPYVLRPAGGLDPWCLSARNALGKGLLLKWLVESELRGAAFLHAMSPAEVDVLKRWRAASDVHCVPHGVSLPGNLDAAKSTFFAAFPQLRNRPFILFLGRLHPKKRADLLIEAFAGVRQRFPSAALVIAGHDDGHEAELRRAVRELELGSSVVFTGFLTGSMKTGAYAAADVFALPSRDENFGMSVVEAMAHGVAPLVTRGVGAHVHVDRAECGLTVDDDVDSIRRGLTNLLAGSPRALGRRGADYVAQHLSWDVVARRLDELYRQAVDAVPGKQLTAA